MNKQELTEKRRKDKVFYNRVKNYGWDIKKAKETPIRKKRKNNVNRKYDVIKGDGTILLKSVTIYEAAQKLRLRLSTVRGYTGYKWRDKVLRTEKGIYLTESEKQQ